MHQTDLHVGKMLRQRRSELGVTQKGLGNKIGVKPQQIQKYEIGTNRISASRLHDISKALNVDVSYFFSNLEVEIFDKEVDATLDINSLLVPNSLRLLKAFSSLKSHKIQNEIIQLVELLSSNNEKTNET